MLLDLAFLMSLRVSCRWFFFMRELLIFLFCVFMKVQAILLLIIRLLIKLIRCFKRRILLDIFVLLMIVVSGCFGLLSILLVFLIFVCIRQLNDLVFLLKYCVMVVVEVWVWCVVLKVLFMQRFVSLERFLVKVLFFFFLFLLKWVFFNIRILFIGSLVVIFVVLLLMVLLQKWILVLVSLVRWLVIWFRVNFFWLILLFFLSFFIGWLR